MKFIIFMILAVVATQAKFLMSPNSLYAAMERNEVDDEPLAQAAMLSEKLYIPMARLMTCNNGACLAVCHALGYKHGRCVSDTTCECYN
ncbi:uncharacterized protein LOC133517074 [Cydia pomonella]|uniref:uncharacterized protein LOC133517074 n=1 Tax=Cydia pomonella TaxID=82600 RepID=UPI002ADD78F2|nr:uncharacterized protein LOC133517074 [Cydia pomonella]XP_061706203.1 uncharacterized protein LOC133517074 [Cydia pomonella]